MRISTVLIVLAGVIGSSFSLPFPFPDSPVFYGGFQPVEGARGVSDYSGGGGAATGGFGGGSGGGGLGGGLGGPVQDAGPTKTIYVNVPQPDPQPAPKPIAAGPPRKHYKIVFIRAPTPPPPPQPILPPRTEQKTIIYVLHQKQEQQQQNVINVPSIKHNPEVYFVQYDNPPTAEELQQLSTGDLSSFGVSQSYGSPSGLGDNAGSGSVSAGTVDSGSSGIGVGFDVRNVQQTAQRGVPLLEVSGAGGSPASGGGFGQGPQVGVSLSSAAASLGPQGFGSRTGAASEFSIVPSSQEAQDNDLSGDIDRLVRQIRRIPGNVQRN